MGLCIYILHPAQRPQSEYLTDGYAGGTGVRTGVVERDREIEKERWAWVEMG